MNARHVLSQECAPQTFIPRVLLLLLHLLMLLLLLPLLPLLLPSLSSFFAPKQLGEHVPPVQHATDRQLVTYAP